MFDYTDTANKLCVYGKIRYTVDADHPDIQYLVNWKKNRVYEYEDVYQFDKNFHGDELSDAMKEYIADDLRLVAGGGYNADHISNVKLEIREITIEEAREFAEAFNERAAAKIKADMAECESEKKKHKSYSR